MKYFTVLTIGLLISTNSAYAQTAETPEDIIEKRLERARGIFANSDAPYIGSKIGRAEWLDDRQLAFTASEYEQDAETFSFDVTDKSQSKVDNDALPPAPERWPAGVGMAGGPGPELLTSPNGRWEVTSDGPNLVLTDLQSGNVKVLTEDGRPDYAYGQGHLIGWSGQLPIKLAGVTPAPSILWSPDSKRFLTFVADTRDVRRVPYIETTKNEDGGPDIKLHKTITPWPGDENLPSAEFQIFTAATGTTVRVDLPEKFVRAGDPLRRGLAAWSEDGEYCVLTLTDLRDRVLTSWRIDAATGKASKIYEETGYFMSLGRPWYMYPRLIGDELLVWSNRDEYAHMYRYNARNGEFLNAVTSGAIHVWEFVGVRENWVYFLAGVLDGERDPYQKQLFRSKLDGSEQEQLTDNNADYGALASSNLDYIFLTERTLANPLSHYLIDYEGNTIHQFSTPKYLEGFIAPERVSGTGRDNRTSVWGTLFKPADFDPSRSYPILHYVHGTVGWTTGPLGIDQWFGMQGQALAELGFIVMVADGIGGGGRTRSYAYVSHDDGHQCGQVYDNLLLMRAVAESRPYMDIGRVGMVGVSQGGNCASRAIFEFPDSVHVAVSMSGNQDSRMINASELHEYIGLPSDDPEAYRAQSNAQLAHQLEGKLMLIHGTLDDDVPLVNSLHLIDALIEGNKDYDLVLIPNAVHAISGNPYVLARIWSYFLEHLRDEKLPAFDNR
ncbi:MAG: prolyl oligopeptidase family serine peptidase [Pseudomonadota bacterium]